MKIIILSPLYYPDRFGGIEKVVYELTRRLGLNKVNTTLICGTTGNEETIIHEGIQIHRLSSSGAFNNGSFEKYYEINNRALKIIHQVNPDLIWAHDWFFALAALNYLESNPVTLISQSHFLKRFESRERITTWRSFMDLMQTLLFRNSKKILAVSLTQIQTLNKNYRIPKNKIIQVKYGMDLTSPNFFTKTNNTYPVFLYLGRLETEKNIDTFLDSIRIFEYRLQQNICIRLVGSGSLQKKLETIAKHLCKVKVEFIPFSSDFAYIQRTILQSDIVVLPSLYESYGISALEAISLKVPVLLSRQCGISEDLPWYPQNLLFDPLNKEEIFEAVQYCLHNLPKLPLIGRHAHKKMQATNNWDLTLKKILENIQPSKKRVHNVI